VPHDEIMFSYVKKAKVIIRTGAFDPYGNMVFVSGVEVSLWYDKQGVTVPDFYKERAKS
jgi:D-ribose pyranase